MRSVESREPPPAAKVTEKKSAPRSLRTGMVLSNSSASASAFLGGKNSNEIVGRERAYMSRICKALVLFAGWGRTRQQGVVRSPNSHLRKRTLRYCSRIRVGSDSVPWSVVHGP